MFYRELDYISKEGSSLSFPGIRLSFLVRNQSFFGKNKKDGRSSSNIYMLKPILDMLKPILGGLTYTLGPGFLKKEVNWGALVGKMPVLPFFLGFGEQ